MSKKLWQYVEDVSNNKIITCKATKRAVNRFKDDLKRSETDSSFEWAFHEAEGDRVVKFIEALKHYGGIS